MYAINNVTILTPEAPLNEHSLLFDEKVRAIVPDSEIQSNNDFQIIDGQGCFLSPGFIDLHIHGAYGFDTMDATLESLETISKNILSHGVTSFLATTMTESIVRIRKALVNIRVNRATVKGANIIGCHLEGPYLNVKYKGAQDESKFILPDISFISEFSDVIKLITIAPEICDSAEFIKSCKKLNIAVSIGHSAATYEEAKKAFAHGVSHATHLFNGMSPLHHRNPGVVGAALDSNITCEMILDNNHLHQSIPRIVTKVKGLDKIVLVTDAMRGCGMPDGDYEMGGRTVSVRDGKVILSGGLAGSVLTINQALKNFIDTTGIPLHRAIQTATANPASVIGITDQKGTLNPNADADLILFDNNFAVRHVFINGEKRL